MSDAPCLLRHSRLRIRKDYIGQGKVVEFPVGHDWYRLDHDELVRIVGETAPFLESRSWCVLGGYSTPHPSRKTLAALKSYRIK